MKALLAAGADPNEGQLYDRPLPLLVHSSSSKPADKARLVKLLSTQAPTSTYKRITIKAAFAEELRDKDAVAVAALLLGGGADPNAGDNERTTPLTVSSR